MARWFPLAWLTKAEPFEFEELPNPTPEVSALFFDSFRAPPPDFPAHFIAKHRATDVVAAYVHYTAHLPGVYLCGGLCVDAGLYRSLSSGERKMVKGRGSLSRWLLNESIATLRDKIAVFAYTGNTMSRRDGLASGFTATTFPNLIVQWHTDDADQRRTLVQDVARLGPF